jgi:hypothetical protein
MLSPEFIQNISQDLVDIYIQMETDLMLNISRKLAVGKPLFIPTLEETPRLVNEWQLERLKQLKGLTLENAKIISKQSGVSVGVVNIIFDKALETGTKADEQLIEQGIKAGILNEVVNINESPNVIKSLKLAKKTTLTTLNEMNKSMLANSNKEYKDIINVVTAKVTSGTTTVQEAMKQAVRKLANKGITSFTAKNGAKWSSEGYISMVTHANIRNMINEVQDERIKESGGDYIEINSYSGARPKCAEDQGKIYSLSGNTTPIKDINGRVIYPKAWSSSTNGQPDGILGINCGHQRFLFMPEISGYDRENINQKENTKDYEEKQQQRLLERNIRNGKREVAMLDNLNADTKKAESKVSKAKLDLKIFLEETGRTRRRTNEWVGV